MKTYTKFLTQIYLKSFLNILLIMFCLIFILNFLSELDFFKVIDVNIFFPLYLSFLNAPTLIFQMLPFVFLISTQFFFNTLINKDEINIFKYSGLKNSKILLILTTLSFILGLIIITIFYNLSSNLKNFYLELKSNYTTDGKYLAVINKNGLWIKDINKDNKTLIINAEKIEQNFLINAYISEFDNNFEIKRNIKSPKINIKNNEWQVLDARIYSENSTKNFELIRVNTNFNYKIIQNLFSNLSSLSFLELIELRNNYKKLNYSLTELDVHLLKLCSYPIYFVLMTVFSSAIMLNTKKYKSNLFKVSIGLFLSVVIYYINNFFNVLGTTEKINLASSVFIPLFFLMIVNFIMIRKINEK
tara:strand:+ start:757 stop:1833 length:1077 start_codon:yes stop_codon:yes gene_type:complete